MLGCLRTRETAVSSSRGTGVFSLLILNNLSVSMLRFPSDNTPNVRENQGHHLRMIYESRLSCPPAWGGVVIFSAASVEFPSLIGSCKRLSSPSCFSVSSTRALAGVTHNNSSSVNLCHLALWFILFPSRGVRGVCPDKLNKAY